MTITELITALEALRAEHGDVKVFAYPCEGECTEPLRDGDVWLSSLGYAVVAP